MALASQTATSTIGSINSRALLVREGRLASSSHKVMADTVMTARVHDPDVLAVSFVLTCFITFDLLSMPLPCPTCFFFHFLLRHIPYQSRRKLISSLTLIVGFFIILLLP